MQKEECQSMLKSPRAAVLHTVQHTILDDFCLRISVIYMLVIRIFFLTEDIAIPGTIQIIQNMG